MNPLIYTVEYGGAGTVSTMAKPRIRAGESLDDTMTALRGRGVDVVVCLLTDDELHDLGLDDEPAAARRAGMDFVQISVANYSVPDHAAFLPVLADLTHHFNQGRHILAHCRFGLGRAALMAAALLTATGCDPDEAWTLVGDARGARVPDTDEQRAWIFRIRPITTK
jgi:protein-tyrosine phosphatase